MHLQVVDDPEDPRLADYVGLTDPDIRLRYASEKFFIAEGFEVVRRLIASDLECRSVVVAANRLDSMRDVLDHAGCPVFVAERDVISRTVGFDLHRGVIASAFRPNPATLDEVLARPPLLDSGHRIAALHGVGDHENLGAIIRSARALHIDALALDPTSADPFYRRSVRVSMGEIFFVPILRSPVIELMDDIRQRRGSSIAFTPRPDAVALETLTIPEGPIVLVFGSEGFGLPDDVLRAAEIRSRIRISPDVDSLNVGHAAAIAFALTSRR